MSRLSGPTAVLILLSLLLCPAQSSSAGDAFLLLTRHGALQMWWPDRERLITLDLKRHFDLRMPEEFIEVAAGEGSIYLLDAEGKVYSVFDRKLLHEGLRRNTSAVDLLLSSTGDSLWLLDSGANFVRIIPGGPPSSFLTSPVLPGLPVAGSLDGFDRPWLLTDQGFFFCPEDYSLIGVEQPFQTNIVDFEFNPSSSGALVADASGQVYPWGEALADRFPLRPEFGQPVVVDLEFSPALEDVYYILDERGGIYDSDTGMVLQVSNPSAAPYQALGVADGDKLFQHWTESFPSLSVRIEPAEILIPYWQTDLQFQLQCENAVDLAEFVCQVKFNPEVLRPGQIRQGPLFPAGRLPGDHS